MSDEDDIEWEYEDESDTAADGSATSPQLFPAPSGEFYGSPGSYRSTPGEEEGVEWEHVGTISSPPSDERGTAVIPAYETDRRFDEIANTDWDHINSVLQREAAMKVNGVSGPELKKKAVRMTKEDKAHEFALHKAHLLLSLAKFFHMNALCQSRLLRGLMLSLLSKVRETTSLIYRLQLLVRWFNEHFRPANDKLASNVKHGGRDMSFESSLLTESAFLRIIWNRQGCGVDLALLFTVACRAIGLKTRLVGAFDPLVVNRHSSATETAVTAPLSLTSRKRPLHGDTSEKIGHTGHQIIWVWCEVLNSSSKTWVAVDAIRRVVDQPHLLENLRGVSAPLTYVFGVEEDGFVTDVTARYVSRWSKTSSRRLGHDWIAQTLRSVNTRVFSGKVGTPLFDLRDRENRTLLSMTACEDMPTTVEGFKNHQVYCLEIHLRQFECVYPRKAIAVFKGHTVYPRKCVQRVRTWFQWRRLGRKVKDNEKDRPVKWHKFKSLKDPIEIDWGDNERKDRSHTGNGLYGYWQTEEVVVHPVKGATVPKNRYGNIELWSPAHLPSGAIHLRLPRIDKVADQLGVDFARVVVGFETRNGMRYPQFDGIVVAELVAEPLLDAHYQLQQSLIDKAIAKNQLLAAKRWERLVKRILLKKRLDEEYGEV